MSILNNLGLVRRRPDAASLYSAIVQQARQPEFYQHVGIPDTTNGRFDLITLHAYIVMRRLKFAGVDGVKLSQSLFDLMFVDMEKNLREMGVGDLSVGRQVKNMAAAYYGRVKAYDDALKNNGDTLEAAFKRNIYIGSTPSSKQLAALVKYLREQVDASTSWTLEQIEAASFNFRPPPTIE